MSSFKRALDMLEEKYTDVEDEIRLSGGWGITVASTCDLAWIYIWRDTPDGRVTFPVNACAVVPFDGGEGRPAFEIQRGDPFVQVFADEDGDYVDVYIDHTVGLDASCFDYPGTTRMEEV